MRGLLDFFRNLLPTKETGPVDLKTTRVLLKPSAVRGFLGNRFSKSGTYKKYVSIFWVLLTQKSPTERRLRKNSVPKHVAIIMDGNGRWAREKGLPVFMGHKKGGDVARRIAEYAAKMGVSYLTLYAFSSENWHRDPSEVNGLMNLLRNYLQHEVQPFMDLNIRLQVIGDRESLPVDIQHLIEDVESKTAPHTGLTLILAISYGSRQEVVHACRDIARQVAQGLLSPEDIDEACMSQCLYTKDIPDPDLFIRTSGEMRISNFLSWQMAYTELCFVSKYWPDFKEKDFLDALQEFGRRARRYGKSTPAKDLQDD